MTDLYLTHYYLSDRKPFLNLSALDGSELKQVLADLREKTQRGESKRAFMDWYVDDRKKSEKKIRELFLKKKGKPEKFYPHYFVLGESSMLKSQVDGMLEIKIPLSEIPAECISFTNPDSMASFDLEKDPKYNKPYHGKVFTAQEIVDLIATHGMPPDELGYTSRYGYPQYIEAQVWSDKPILAYL